MMDSYQYENTKIAFFWNRLSDDIWFKPRERNA